MKKYQRVSLMLSMVITILFQSCNSSENLSDSFNRTAFLTHFADELIIPAYSDLSTSILALETAAQNFAIEKNTETLQTLQNAWLIVYEQWQYANIYNFGPAAEAGLQKSLNEEIGTYPVLESRVNEILETGTYNLNDFQRDARGIFAIEYLIFSRSASNQIIVDAFVNQNRVDYLLALIANCKTKVSTVLTAWQGDYRIGFINNSGTDAGSSTSMLYNEFVKSFEGLKNFKVSLPLGLRIGQTEVAPHLVEAYYSGASLKGIRTHWLAMKNIWYGINKTGENGLGFDDYLQAVAGGEALIASTILQMSFVDTALTNINNVPVLATQIEHGDTMDALVALNTELQKQTRFFKSDLSSLIGIAITYISGDGD